VLRNVRAMGGTPGRILLVGCEAESFGDPEEGRMGLSASVGAAVEEAVGLVESLVRQEAAAHA
jgi:hydrogenase maturation protease